MSENIEVVSRAFDAFNRRMLSTLLEVVDPEIEFFPVTRVLSKRGGYRGHDGLKQYFSDIDQIWDSLEVVPLSYRDDGDHVVTYGRVRGRSTKGVTFDTPVDWIWRLREGKIVWGSIYAKRDEHPEAPISLNPSAERTDQ